MGGREYARTIPMKDSFPHPIFNVISMIRMKFSADSIWDDVINSQRRIEKAVQDAGRETQLLQDQHSDCPKQKSLPKSVFNMQRFDVSVLRQVRHVRHVRWYMCA